MWFSNLKLKKGEREREREREIKYISYKNCVKRNNWLSSRPLFENRVTLDFVFEFLFHLYTEGVGIVYWNTVNRLRAGRYIQIPLRGNKTFSFPELPGQLWGSPSLTGVTNQGYSGWDLKLTRHLHVVQELSYTPTPSIWIHGVNREVLPLSSVY